MARRKIGRARRHVILTDLQAKTLSNLAEVTGMPVSEHIRRAVDYYFMIVQKQAEKRTPTGATK